MDLTYTTARQIANLRYMSDIPLDSFTARQRRRIRKRLRYHYGKNA